MEWRNEKFLEWPHRHSRYFRIFLFATPHVQGQESARKLEATWGAWAVWILLIALLRFLYVQGGRADGRADGRASVGLRGEAWSLVSWDEWISALLLSPEPRPTTKKNTGTANHQTTCSYYLAWKNATVLVGIQLYVVCWGVCFLQWLSLVSPMLQHRTLCKAAFWLSIITLPILAYAVASWEHSACLPQCRLYSCSLVSCVTVLWIVPLLFTTFFVPWLLPSDVVSRFSQETMTSVVMGMLLAMILFTGSYYSSHQHSRQQQEHHPRDESTATATLASEMIPKQTVTERTANLATTFPLILSIDAMPYMFLGMLPFYFWSAHVSYLLAILWDGEQFHVNFNALRTAWLHSTLLIALGCVGLHICLIPSSKTGLCPDNSWNCCWSAGIVVGLVAWCHCLYYYMFESYLEGSTQGWIFLGYTTIGCAMLSFMYAGVTVLTHVTLQHYENLLATKVRIGLDHVGQRARSFVVRLWHFAKWKVVSSANNHARDD